MSTISVVNSRISQTVAILDEIEQDLARHEQRLGELLRTHSEDQVKPPTPTTMAAVS